MSSEISLSKIRESEVALRAVNRQSEKYLELVESVRKNGVLMPILVRPVANTDEYCLIDGLHRFTAAKDAGRENIKVNVVDMTDDQLMEVQIVANYHKVDTKPVEYTKQIVRMFAANPTVTLPEMADKLSVQIPWLRDRLSLVDLSPKIQELVDAGKIKLANAYSLAKLPEEEQPDYVDRAMTDAATEFQPVVAKRVKEIRDAKLQGRKAAAAEFVPVQKLRSVVDVKAELASGEIARRLGGSTEGIEGFLKGIAWVLNADADSVEAQRIKWENNKKQREEEKARAKAEREAKKQDEAAKTAAAVS